MADDAQLSDGGGPGARLELHSGRATPVRISATDFPIRPADLSSDDAQCCEPRLTTPDDGPDYVEIARTVTRARTIDDLARTARAIQERPQTVVDLLRAARERRLSSVAGRSYRHPNGFAKIVILDAGPERTSVRLHVWPAAGKLEAFDGVPRGDTAPHSHRWRFASILLAGSGLVVDEFGIGSGDHGDPHDRYVFEPGVTTDLRPADRARLTGRSRRLRRRGQRDVYVCDADLIHTVTPVDDGMTATLVLQGPEISHRALVFRRPDAPPDPRRGVLDEDTVGALIDEVVDSLGSRARADRPLPRAALQRVPCTRRWLPSGC